MILEFSGIENVFEPDGDNSTVLQFRLWKIDS